jgi:hypothetical protein
MRRATFTLAAVTAAVLATAGTAQAAPYPYITKQSCEDKGGTFAKKGTTRTCTYSVEDQLVYTAGSRSQTEPDPDGFYYVLVVDETETCDRTYQTVQLRRQEPETDQISESDCSSETIRRCYRLEYPDSTIDESKEVDVTECSTRGLS